MSNRNEIAELLKESLANKGHFLGSIDFQQRAEKALTSLQSDTSERVEEVEPYKAKQLCTHFFRWWYNQPGTNTDQGFDAWMETDEAKRIVQPTGSET